MNINIRNGNVIDELKKIPDESVDCVVSSPPYYGLRSYIGAETIWGGNPKCEHDFVDGGKSGLLHDNRNGVGSTILSNNERQQKIHEKSNNTHYQICSKCNAWKGQLGLEPTYQMYIDHLMIVMKELKRVLKKTGTLFWNMGDSYASSGNPNRHFGYPDPKWDKARNGNFEEPTAFDQGIKPKSLMGIPERFMIAMLDDGWVLRNKLPWIKMNAMPSSKKDGFTPKWEYVYFFTKKSQSYYFDLDSIRKPLADSSIKRISQKNIPNQFKLGKSAEFAETNPVNNIPKILNNMHKKYNGVYSNLTPEESEKYGSPRARNMRDHEQSIDNIDPNGANPGDILFDDTIYDIFTNSSIQDAFVEYLEQERPELLMPSVLDIPTMPHSFAHFAVFPETLVDPLMKAGCPSEVCVKCGKPKLPFFVDTGRYYDHGTGEYAEYHTRETKMKIMDATGVSDSSVFNTELIKERVTKWIPSCKCNAGFESGTVLDPFAGSGTVGVVAKKQGKSAILIEISPEYAEIIKNRLEIEGSGTNMNVKFVETASISSLEEDE
jgi:DNA modification methylase